MFKNQLQELAQRSCFNLPAYASTREGPDHAPRFKACVNFNGEIFESPGYCPTLRQAEHAAAEVALNVLSTRGSKSLTARILDETGVYKNLLQETAHKAGLNLPVYTTVRSGPGHVPVFTCTVELAAMTFTGESAKTKKQAEKNAAISAWSALKKMPSLVPKKEVENQQEEQEHVQDQVIVSRVLSNFRAKAGGGKRRRDYYYYQRRSGNSRSSFKNYNKPWVKQLHKPLELPQKGPENCLKVKEKSSFVDLLPPPPPRTTSKILPLTSSDNSNNNSNNSSNSNNSKQGQNGKFQDEPNKKTDTSMGHSNPSNVPRRMPLSCAQMGILGNYNFNPRGIAPAVQIRSIIPVCAAPPPAVKPLPCLNPTLSSKEASSSVNHLSSELSKVELK